MKCGSFFFQAEDGIRDDLVTGVQTCALPICSFIITNTKVKMYNIDCCSLSSHLVPSQKEIATATAKEFY